MSTTWRDINGPYELWRSAATRQPDTMFPRISPTGRIAWKTHEGGFVGGIPAIIMEPTLGNWPVAWGPLGLYVQQNMSGKLSIFDPDTGWRIGFARAEYRAEGIHHIAEDGTPVMGGGEHVTVAGVELWNASSDQDGNWVGLSNGGGPHGCVALVRPDGTARMWVCPDDNPFPPRVDRGRVAISGTFDTPSPADFARDAVPFVPYVEPAPVLTLPTHPRPMLRGSFGSPNIPGSNVGGSGHPLAVIDGFTYITEADKPKLKGVIWDVTNRFDTSRDDAIKLCKETGAALVCYDDGHDIEAQMQAAAEAEGVRVVHAICGYPDVTVTKSGRPAILVSALYSAWPDQAVADNLDLNQVWSEQGDYLGELFVGIDRRPPQAPKQWAIDYAIARCQQTPPPDWSAWPQTPRPVNPEPVPEPQPVPQPVRPTKPGSGHVSRKAKAFGKLLGR